MIIQCVPNALELNCISIPYICNGFTRVRSIFAHVQVLEHKPPKFPYPVLFASISGIPGGEVNGGTVFDFLFATYCFFFCQMHICCLLTTLGFGGIYSYGLCQKDLLAC